jgi:GntR family transcriptional regulator, frlABCD operon transcriptional regulator
MTVEYDNLTPLYDQVKRLILGDLKTGRYRSGTYLPSETDLCEHYQVSRITLRRSVSELCSEGYLKRVHGKGTLVTTPKLQQTLISLTGFTESLASRGHSVSYRVLEKGDYAPPEGVRNRLRAASDDQVVGIRRLLMVDDRPLTIEELYFLRSRYEKAIAPVIKAGSFYEALKTFYDEQPSAAERTINVDFPSPGECELLACPPSQPVYRIEKLVIGRKENPVSFSVLVTPSNRVTYFISV